MVFSGTITSHTAKHAIYFLFIQKYLILDLQNDLSSNNFCLFWQILLRNRDNVIKDPTASNIYDSHPISKQ